MSKFVLTVRHRPTMAETIDERFAHFVSQVHELQAPWGLLRDNELSLPPVGSGLSTSVKLRGKLGAVITGTLTFSYRAPTNLRDLASHDDSVVIEFDSRKVQWHQFVSEGLVGYVRAMEAYIARVYRWDVAPDERELKVAASHRSNKNLDGRDGFFRFGPASFMDRELCRRSCNGMTPEQIAVGLTGAVPEVRLLADGVLIVATDHFAEQSEIVAMDRVIRTRLGLPIWG